MQISLTLNGKKITEEIAADLLLIDFVRNHGCYSVKRGCETSNCGLCTVFLDEKPVLSWFRACCKSMNGHKGRYAGRTAGGSRRIWLFYRRTGGGAVRIL